MDSKVGNRRGSLAATFAASHYSLDSLACPPEVRTVRFSCSAETAWIKRGLNLSEGGRFG
jgi:hypothetical protein